MAGIVRAGDDNMSSGGSSEGGNQVNQIVVTLKEPITNDRKYTVRREPDLTYYVMRDGALEEGQKYRKIKKDMTVGDYDKVGIFKKAGRVAFFGINPNPISIIVPVTIRLSDMTSLPGTIAIDVCCNEECPENLISLLGTDYAQKKVIGNIRTTSISADDLSKLIRNPIQDKALETLIETDSPTRFITSVRSMLFDKLDNEVAFQSKGLLLYRASLRFDISLVEKTEQLRAFANKEMEEDRIKHEKNMLKFDLASEEYDKYHGGA